MVAAVGGLWFSGVQTQQANEQARHADAQARDDRELAKEGQITDRYTAAVGNLGEDKVDVRLGGIYALQRIMQDSHRDQPTIANVLATYVRTHTVKPPKGLDDLPADVHAALTVLADRDTTHDDGFSLDLRDANLRGAKLTPGNPADQTSGAALNRANLSGANLTGASLIYANLSDAELSDANLRGADLTEADLSDADLSDANLKFADVYRANLSDAYLGDADLSGSDLSGADLSDAYLGDADLSGSDLSGADLSQAWKLTKRQVDSARISSRTQLPDSLS